MKPTRLDQIVFGIERSGFEEAALALYRKQAIENEVFARFHALLQHDASEVRHIPEMRFLPIAFFKTHKVICRGLTAALEFSSSVTTGSLPGLHPVVDPALYEDVFTRIFNSHYGDKPTTILALLPSYLERSGSSLIYMVDRLIKRSSNELSGFFLDRFDELRKAIDQAKKEGQRVILFTVTFALLKLAELNFDLQGVVVIETGGMKGRGRELIREELLGLVKSASRPLSIDSEYGMTELLSQAYSGEDGMLKSPLWMKMLVREADDPFCVSEQGKGLLNVIDLANADSCAFIATDDLASVSKEGFMILGRTDNSEIRGCNLMLSL